MAAFTYVLLSPMKSPVGQCGMHIKLGVLSQNLDVLFIGVASPASGYDGVMYD